MTIQASDVAASPTLRAAERVQDTVSKIGQEVSVESGTRSLRRPPRTPYFATFCSNWTISPIFCRNSSKVTISISR